METALELFEIEKRTVKANYGRNPNNIRRLLSENLRDVWLPKWNDPEFQEVQGPLLELYKSFYPELYKKAKERFEREKEHAEFFAEMGKKYTGLSLIIEHKRPNLIY